MAFLSYSGVEIRGVAACVPRRIEENRCAKINNADDIEQYIQAVGIERRHCAVADGSVCTSDLCFESASKLIEELRWNREEIDLVVFVSHTADYKLPATSCILQHRLGLSKECMAFDVSYGCSGYVYGLGIIGNLMSSGNMRKALLLVGNTQSVYASPQDRSTSLLFGDAGTATALEYNPECIERMSFYFATDGSKKDVLIVPDGGCRNPVNLDSFKMEDFGAGVKRTRLHEMMDGAEVFMFGISSVPKSIKTLLARVNLNIENIDYLLLHQANKMLCEKIRSKLKFPPEKVPYNLRDYGNTSGATIPLLMVTELQNALINKKLNLLLAGFGVGLSMGSAVIVTNNIVCPNLLYI